METEEALIPAAQVKYDEWIGIFKRGEAALLDKLNAILAQHGLPAMKEYSLQVDLLRLRSQDPELKTALRAIDDEHRQIARHRAAALDLYDRERNIKTFHTGVLYTCEIILYRPWEKDMDGDAFQKDRCYNIFTTATQSGADGVILYNCMDTAADFGSPDTIYAVFEYNQIKILEHEVYEE